MQSIECPEPKAPPAEATDDKTKEEIFLKYKAAMEGIERIKAARNRVQESHTAVQESTGAFKAKLDRHVFTIKQLESTMDICEKVLFPRNRTVRDS